MDEIERIAAVLEQHGTVPGPHCHCGYRYRLGESIAMHRATAVSASLMLHKMGIADGDLVQTTAATLRLVQPEHYERPAA